MRYAHTMKSSRHIARLAAAVGLAVGAGVVAIPGSTLPVQAVVCSSTLCGGGEFHPLTPARIFDSRPALAVNDVAPLEDVKVPLPRSLRIRIPAETALDSTVDALHTLFLERKGEARVLFDVERKGDFMVVMEAEGYNVLPDRNFLSRVEELCGRGSVRIID